MAHTDSWEFVNSQDIYVFLSPARNKFFFPPSIAENGHSLDREDRALT
jgi:hypothetical protein